MTVSLEGFSQQSWILLSESFSGFSRFFDNPVNLNTILLLFDTLFNVHVAYLLSIVALSMMILHATVTMDLLDETNH